MKLPWLTVAIAVAVAAVNAPLLAGGEPIGGEQLELRGGSLSFTEPWRLFLGHGVHWSTEHLLLDLLAFILLGAACERELGPRFGLLLLTASAAISLSLLLVMEVTAYRGLSGVESALLVAAALTPWRVKAGAKPRVLGALALAVFVGKVTYECTTGEALFCPGVGADGVAPAPLAHAIGALVGWAFGRPGRGKQRLQESAIIECRTWDTS